MKTFKEIMKQKPVFLHNWKHKNDVIIDFEGVYMTNDEYEADKCPYENVKYWIARKEELTKAIRKHEKENILFASYGEDNYSGDAFVLFEKDGVLYEVNGSHCSCYGLEGQWNAEETNIETLAFRLEKGTLGKDGWSGNEFHDELCKFLGIENC